MARFKTVAGYFKEVVEKQPIKIEVNKMVTNEDGSPAFKEDGVTPILERVLTDAEVDVRNIVWVDEVRIPLTEEEEAQKDAEEAEHERVVAQKKIDDLAAAKKVAIDKITLEQSNQILMEDDEAIIRQIKLQYRADKAAIEAATDIEQLPK